MPLTALSASTRDTVSGDIAIADSDINAAIAARDARNILDYGVMAGVAAATSRPD